MIMNRKNSLKILVIFLLAFLSACTDDPKFPDPGFDLLSDKNFTIWRDTADAFTIRLNVKALAGIDMIQIIDGRTYEVQEELLQYRGKKEFLLEHDLSFENINPNQDSVLICMVRILTNDHRAFNSSFKINLKKLSFPEIVLPHGDIIGTSVPAVGINGIVATGMYKLESIKIYMDGKEAYVVPKSEFKDTSEYQLAANIIHDFKVNEEYLVEIEVVDERGELGKKSLTVKGIELKKPKGISVTRDGNMEGFFDIEYDEQGRIQKMLFTCAWDTNEETYLIVFNYGVNGKVSRVEYWSPKTTYRFRKEFIDYTYEGDQLVKAEHGKFPWDEPDNITLYETIQNIKYRDDGTISSFDANNNTIKEVQYIDGFGVGEKIFVERWSGYLSNLLVGQRIMKTNFVPVAMPTYMEEFPPVCPLIGSLGIAVMDLCNYKYLSVLEAPGYGNTQPGTTYFRLYNYTCDENGQLLTLTRKEMKYDYWFTYIFHYE